MTVNMTNSSFSSDTQSHDRPFPLRMARYAVQQGREPTSALASQLVILRAMGRTNMTLEDLRGNWGAIDYLHLRIGQLTLAGALCLDSVLRKYGVQAETHGLLAELGLESGPRINHVEWLMERVEDQRGVVVLVETDELPTLAALYGDADYWPDAACALLVIGIMRDARTRQVLSYLVIDPALGEYIRSHGPIAIPAMEFEAAWHYRGCEAVATLEAARRPRSLPRASDPRHSGN